MELELGLTEAQKSAMETAGLTKSEIKEIDEQRIADNIAKERAKLDKLEKKIGKDTPPPAEPAENGDEGKVADAPKEGEKNFFDNPPPTTPQTQEGDDAPIFSNEELLNIVYYKYGQHPEAKRIEGEIGRLMDEGEVDGDEMKKLLNEKATIASDIAEPLFKRRDKGYEIQYKQWVEGGKQGKQPQSSTMAYTDPIFLGAYLIS